MKIDGRPALNMADSHRWGTDPRIDVRYLPIDLAMRIENFMQVHYIDGEKEFNCFTFMQYVTGLHYESGNRSWNFRFHGDKVDATELRPFRPYVLFQGSVDYGKPMHGLVCFTGTGVCLSVLGNDQPLTWAPLDGLTAAYGSDTIMEVSHITQ